MEDLPVKILLVVAVMLVTLSSFPLISQQTSPQQASPSQQEGNPGAGQSVNPPTGSASSPDASATEMSPVNAELVGKLDSTTAKTGDSIVVKTESSVKTADGTMIPKGTKLVGRVIGVMPQGAGSQNSQVSIQFDHAEVTGGQSVPIQTVIRSIGPAGSGSETSTSDAIPSAPSAPSAPAASASGGSAAGGGLAGNSPRTGPTGNEPQSANPAGSAPSANPGASGDNGSNAPAPGTIVARSGNIAIRTTSIPGVLIANNDKGQDPRMAKSSGILLGAQRNIDLDSGTMMELAVSMGAH
jgi:hypothetical protein